MTSRVCQCLDGLWVEFGEVLGDTISGGNLGVERLEHWEVVQCCRKRGQDESAALKDANISNCQL